MRSPLHTEEPEATGQDVPPVSNVRRILHETFERAGDARHTPLKAKRVVVFFGRHFVSKRRDWQLSVDAHRVASQADEEKVLREVQLAVMRHPEVLTRAGSKTQLMSNWNDLLIEATAKVERDRRDADLLTPDADDDAVAEASLALAAERWRK